MRFCLFGANLLRVGSGEKGEENSFGIHDGKIIRFLMSVGRLFSPGEEGHFILDAIASGTRTGLGMQIPRNPIWKRLLGLRLGNFEIQWDYRLDGSDGLIKIHIQGPDVVLAVGIIVGRIMNKNALGGIKD